MVDPCQTALSLCEQPRRAHMQTPQSHHEVPVINALHCVCTGDNERVYPPQAVCGTTAATVQYATYSLKDALLMSIQLMKTMAGQYKLRITDNAATSRKTHEVAL